MASLKSVLDRLKAEVLADDFEVESTDDLETFVLTIESVLDMEKLADVSPEGSQPLPPELAQLYNALVYTQTHWDLYSTIAFDGLLSVFYNETGLEIERTRRVLKESNSPISPHFERAYAIATPAFELVPETNWVARRGLKEIDDVLSEQDGETVETIEQEISELQDACYDVALGLCKDASTACRS